MVASKNLAFEWDSANLAHIRRHGVTAEEAEEVISGASLPLETVERLGEQRNVELGATAEGKLLIVVWTRRQNRIRVITAFPANRKWRSFWRGTQEKGGHG
jgi:uncharacterized DUF497 family protein